MRDNDQTITWQRYKIAEADCNVLSDRTLRVINNCTSKKWSDKNLQQIKTNEDEEVGEEITNAGFETNEECDPVLNTQMTLVQNMDGYDFFSMFIHNNEYSFSLLNDEDIFFKETSPYTYIKQCH